MARCPRRDVFDPSEVSVWHCINRCVRRCFLCGADPATGYDYEHRKTWMEDRLRILASCFGIDILGFAIMSNHFHVVLRNRPDVVATWSDAEVARRWYFLCPVRRHGDGRPEEPNEAERGLIVNDARRLAEIRRRLSDISWFMRMIAEPVARRANKEDQCSGRFWQGRFKAVKLCDDAALLACSVYVDLNPIRAGQCSTPEASQYTSAHRRMAALPPGNNSSSRCKTRHEDEPVARSPDEWLAPLPLDELASPGPMPSQLGHRASDKGFLPMTLEEYLILLDWTGRQVTAGKRGSIPSRLAPILSRLEINESRWVELATGFGTLFYRMAGRPSSLGREARRRGRRWYQAPGRKLLCRGSVGGGLP